MMAAPGSMHRDGASPRIDIRGVYVEMMELKLPSKLKKGQTSGPLYRGRRTDVC